jgi:multiple sugar transport system substrate-binding protein
MNLLGKDNMIMVYLKKIKKSIRSSTQSMERMDIFFILSLFLLIIGPFFVNIFVKINTDIKRVNLFLSPSSEEILGKETTEALLRNFWGLNPDMRIHLLNTSDPSASQGYNRGREPDIFIFTEGDFSALVAQGALMDLSQYTNSDTRYGAQLAIPLVSFMGLLFYNIDILSAAGFDRPPKTREDFLSSARAVSAASNNRILYIAGAGMSLASQDRQALSRDVFSWIWAAGSDFWSNEAAGEEAGGVPVVNTRDITAGFSFLSSLYRDNIFAPGVFNTTGEQRLEEFAQGRIAMMIASTRDIPFLRERMGDNAFGITTIPIAASGPVGRYSIGLSGIYAGINAKCQYHNEAWNFLVFLAGQSASFCETFKAVPGVVSDIIPGDYVKNDPFYSKAWDIFESSNIVQGFSGKPGAEEYKSIFLEELQVFFESRRSAQDTSNAIQERFAAVNLQ